MSKKLHFRASAKDGESFVELDQAREWNYDDLSRLVVIEGQLVRSFKELCAAASKAQWKDKEVLEVWFVPAMGGG